MREKINQQYILDFLEDILNTPSPSGFTTRIMSKIQKEAERLGYDFQLIKKGGGVITIEGENPDYVTCLSAHVDTLGAMVRSINSSGTIRFTSIGGYMMTTVEGEYCQIHTRTGQVYSGTALTIKPSVHVYPDAKDLKREEAKMEIRIDELVNSKEDVEKLGIGIGDFISWDPRAEIKENGFIKSRHLDDKSGVAILFGLLEMMIREGLKPTNTLKFLISSHEEVGHGAAYIPAEIDEMIAIDMGAMGDDLACTERGVSICAKDSSGPYDYDMVSKLIELAKQEKLDYTVDIYPYYGSDVSAALRGGNNIRGGLVGPGVHASHCMERTHIDGLINTLLLLAAYILR